MRLVSRFLMLFCLVGLGLGSSPSMAKKGKEAKPAVVASKHKHSEPASKKASVSAKKTKAEPASKKNVKANSRVEKNLSKHAAAKGKNTSVAKVGVGRHARADKHPVVAVAPRVRGGHVQPVALAKMSRSRVEADTSDDGSVSVDGNGNPLLKSAAFFVQDLRTGQVLLEKNADNIVPIASITKLMTAMVVLDARLPLNETLEIKEDNVDRLKGTSSRLAVGTRMTREEFMRLALMSSENRAASVLSYNYPGGVAAFVAAMNAKARQLSMQDTRFFDGSGLNHNNVSSPRDLATMVSTAAKYPLIREFTTTAEHTADLPNGRSLAFHNTNPLVKSPDWQIDVSKTGFINESGKCLVMQAWMANKPLAIVLLDSWGRYTRTADAARVKKWLEEVLPRSGHKLARG